LNIFGHRIDYIRSALPSSNAQRTYRLDARDPASYLVSGNRYNWLQLTSTSDCYRFTPETLHPTIPILSIRSEPLLGLPAPLMERLHDSATHSCTVHTGNR